MSKWISIEEQDAPKKGSFLAYLWEGMDYAKIFGGKERRVRKVSTCIWDDFNERFIADCNCSGYEIDREYIEVTQWMPLPKPPEDYE
jgi:hypothetical protein